MNLFKIANSPSSILYIYIAPYSDQSTMVFLMAQMIWVRRKRGDAQNSNGDRGHDD